MARSQAHTVAISDGPAWFNALTEKTWTRIAGGSAMPQAYQRGNTMQTVYNTLPSKPPGVSPAPNVIAYGGGCFDQSRNEFAMPAGGGHNDYYGNESYVLKVDAAIPEWIRLNSPTAAAVSGGSTGSLNGSNGQFNADVGVNNFPASSHLWQCVTATPGKHWKVTLGGMAGGVFGSSSALFSFDRGTNAWTRHGNMFTFGPFAGAGAAEQGTSIYDPIGGFIWHGMKGGSFPDYYPPLIRVNVATAAATVYSIGRLSDAGQWMVVIPDSSSAGRTIIAGANGDLGNQVRWLDPNNPTNGWQSSGISTSGTLFYGYTYAWHYHAASNALFCWKNTGSSLMKITVPANPRSGTYTRVADVAASGSQSAAEIPPAGDEYIATRFQIVQNMGGGRAAAFLWIRPDLPAWVYKFPAGALS